MIRIMKKKRLRLRLSEIFKRLISYHSYFKGWIKRRVIFWEQSRTFLQERSSFLGICHDWPYFSCNGINKVTAIMLKKCNTLFLLLTVVLNVTVQGKYLLVEFNSIESGKNHIKPLDKNLASSSRNEICKSFIRL